MIISRAATHTDYTLSSTNFTATFRDKKTGRPGEESAKKVLELLLYCLEIFPTNPIAAANLIKEKMEDWNMVRQGTGITITKALFKENISRVKILVLTFSSLRKAEMKFSVKKNIKMETLTSIAASSVVSCLHSEEEIKELVEGEVPQVPAILVPDMMVAFRNTWRRGRRKDCPHCKKLKIQAEVKKYGRRLSFENCFPKKQVLE